MNKDSTNLLKRSMTRRELLKAVGLGAAGLALGPVLSSCSTGGGQQANASGKTEIVWMVRNDPVENPWEFETVKPEFEKAHPNIQLKIISINQPDIVVKRQAMLAANEPLHVWSPNWGGNGFGSDRVRGLLRNLTPLMKRDNFNPDIFIPGLAEIYAENGNYYGLPQLTTGSYVFYNKNLFDKDGIEYPPTDWDDKSWTWDKFVETAAKLTKNYGSISHGQYGATVSVINNDLEGPPRSWGHEVWPKSVYENGFADSVACSNESSISAFQAYHDIVYKHKVAPNPAITDGLSALGGAMPSGKVAMEIQGGWDLWVLKDFINDPNGFCFGIAPLPMGTPDAKERSVIFTDPWSITNDIPDEKVEASWTFVKFLMSEDAARAYMEKTGSPPAQKALLDDYYKIFEKCMKHDDMKRTFEGAFDHGKESSNHLMVQWDQLQQIWINHYDPFFSGTNSQASSMLNTLQSQTTNKVQQIKAQWSETS